MPEFNRQVIDDKVRIGYGIETGDVDGDGLPDILVADKEQFAWYRNPDWKRYVMIEKLTEMDNVCLAARDINGDGMVEVAVGARWNPGETSDETRSGSVHYLIRPDDPTKTWKPIQLHHEPTVHRMHWIRVGNSYQLVVLPLHGRGNKDGTGAGVKILAYIMPDVPGDPWSTILLDENMHLTHNFDVITQNGYEALLIGGKEGAMIIRNKNGKWLEPEWVFTDHGFGEIRQGKGFIAGIQPMHGHMLTVYSGKGDRKILTGSMNQGHALAIADLSASGREQILAGWRENNGEDEMGIKLFIPGDQDWTRWESIWIDRNGIACEDLKVADLDMNGKNDI
ncbi:MAG: VCBS repeat-containing protein, partial [Cyclobacteriaceae bacterium]|nr:VCBS repeat-containing protein [Cyclobacteriaceae bacterium]